MKPLLLALLAWVVARQNAAIVILCRNSDKNDIKKTLLGFEQKINGILKYPYVFLNNTEWAPDFISELNIVTENRASYGVISEKDWGMPPSIDRNLAETQWNNMAKTGVPYANMESYHNMCRYFSRTFYKHPLLASFEYYWRIEPGVEFHCEIDSDPFDFMKHNNKMYGCTITIYEFMESIKTLNKVTNEFIMANQSLMPKGNDTLKFMLPNEMYNGCHFWSNFEIASFSFFRSELYNKYVDYLEEKGGFYYERWGDAPVHSLAVARFLDKKQVHFFENIGYTHPPFTHCPTKGKNCNCDITKSVDYTPGSCLAAYQRDYL